MVVVLGIKIRINKSAILDAILYFLLILLSCIFVIYVGPKIYKDSDIVVIYICIYKSLVMLLLNQSALFTSDKWHLLRTHG